MPSFWAVVPRRVSSTSHRYASSTLGVFLNRLPTWFPRPPQPIRPTVILLFALWAKALLVAARAAVAAADWRRKWRRVEVVMAGTFVVVLSIAIAGSKPAPGVFEEIDHSPLSGSRFGPG